MDHNDFDYLQSSLCVEALEVIRYPDILEDEAYRAMINEQGFHSHWWDGAFPQNEEDQKAVAAAAHAFAHRKPLPPLTLAQRGRFALRIRLASRILRAYSSRNLSKPATGWFPAKLYGMQESDLIAWLLGDAADFILEIFDETLSWEDGLGPLDTTDKLHEFPPGS